MPCGSFFSTLLPGDFGSLRCKGSQHIAFVPVSISLRTLPSRDIQLRNYYTAAEILVQKDASSQQAKTHFALIIREIGHFP